MVESPESTDSPDDVCQSAADVSGLVASQPRLAYEPRAVEVKPNLYEIRADREDPDVIPWGFWGGVVAALVGGYILFSGVLAGPAVDFSVVDLAVIAGLGMTGLVLYRLGRKSTLDEMALCTLDMREQIISWPTADDGVPPAVAFQDVQEVIFAIVDVPVEGSRSEAQIDAASVELRDGRGRALPLVAPTTSKGEAHRIARMIAEVFGLSVNYQGTGVSEWADRTPLSP